MKKIYKTPHLEIFAIVNAEQLCKGGGLVGFSATNESNGKKDSQGPADSGEDPEWGTAGAKHFNCWEDWNE